MFYWKLLKKQPTQNYVRKIVEGIDERCTLLFCWLTTAMATFIRFT